MIRKLKNYMQSLSPAAKASFWFVVANLAMKGISFITTPIFTRLLSVEDYGITSVFLSWEGVISILATLVLSGGVYNVAMTKYEEDIDTFTSSMLGLTALLSTVVFGACIAFNAIFPQVFELSSAYLVYMWVQTFTNACASFWLMRKRFYYQYKSVIAYSFFNAFAGPIIAILAIFLFPQNKALAKVIGAGIGAIVLGFAIFFMLLRKGKKLFHKSYWTYALKFSLPLLPHHLSGILMSSADKLMINGMIGTAQAGIYGIAHSITGVVGLVTQAINMSLIPYTLQSIKKGTCKGLSRIIAGCSILVCVVCAAITMFAREGVLIFATEEYLPAVQFVAPLALAVSIEFLSGIIGNIVFYYEKTAFMSRVTIITSLVNIVTNYFGIQWFGYLAAGYTTLFSTVLRTVLYYIGVRKFEKNISQIVNLPLLLLVFGGYIALTVVALIFADFLWGRIGLLIGMAVIVVIFRKHLIVMFQSMKNGE